MAVRATDDPAPELRSVTDADSPPPTPDQSLGTRLYDAALPLVGTHRAGELATIAKALDVAPELGQLIGTLLRPDPSASTMAGQRPAAPPHRSPVRWTTVVLSTAAFAVIMSATLVVWMELRSVIVRAHEFESRMESRVAHNEGQAAEVRRQEDARAIATKEEISRLAAKSAANERTLGLLTDHAVHQLAAIAKKTGADQLTEWTEVPDDLKLVVIQRRQLAKQTGGG